MILTDSPLLATKLRKKWCKNKYPIIFKLIYVVEYVFFLIFVH